MATVLLIFLFGSPFAGASEGRKTDGHVHWEKRQGLQQWLITVDPDFHFNTKAPAFLKMEKEKPEIAPSILTEKKLIFKIPMGSTWSSKSQIFFYVCDDAKTVCEPHEIKGSGITKSPSRIQTEISDTFATSALKKVIHRSLREKKLVLLDFGASWCPACIRMENEVIHNSEFKSQIQKKYLVFNLDVDRPENAALMEKFHVKAFPTLVVVNGKWEELGRFLDFQGRTIFTDALLKISDRTPVFFKELETKAHAGDSNAALAYADALSVALRTKEADGIYRQFNIKSKKAILNRISFHEQSQPDDKNEYEKALKEALSLFPEDYEAAGWKKSLAVSLGEKSPEYKELLTGKKGALASAEAWIDDPSKIKEAHLKGNLLEIKDLEISELWGIKAEVYELIGDKEKALAAWEKASEQIVKLSLGVDSPTHILYLVQYLKKSGKWSDAETWLSRLAQKYPSEFTYPHRFAKLYFEKKDWKRAQEYAEKAYGLSYGSNKLIVGVLICKIYLAARKSEDAKKLIAKLVADPFLENERNHRLKTEIVEIQKELLSDKTKGNE